MFKRLFNYFLDLLFPIYCLSCQQMKSKKTELGFGQGFLCKHCWQKIRFSAELRINKKFYTKPYKSLIKEVVVALDYNEYAVAELIKALKFKSISVISEILAEILIIYWQGRDLILKNNLIIERPHYQVLDIILIPIPLSKKRHRQRGFNQSELIAKHFCQAFHYHLNTQLRKRRNVKAQSKLKPSKRLNNLEKAFVWCGDSLENKIVILLDDVVTTGATIFEAALVLKEAGAKEIFVLAVAS